MASTIFNFIEMMTSPCIVLVSHPPFWKIRGPRSALTTFSTYSGVVLSPKRLLVKTSLLPKKPYFGEPDYCCSAALAVPSYVFQLCPEQGQSWHRQHQLVYSSIQSMAAWRNNSTSNFFLLQFEKYGYLWQEYSWICQKHWFGHHQNQQAYSLNETW